MASRTKHAAPGRVGRLAGSGGRSEDQRRTMIDAARVILDELGPESLTIRALADASGSTTMAVYSRFGGKEGVVEALFEEGFRELAAALGRVRQTRAPSRDLVRLTCAYRDFAVALPTLYSVMFERVIPEFRPSANTSECAWHAFEILLRFTERAARLDVGDDTAPDMAYAVWAIVHGLVTLELNGMGGRESPADFEAVFRSSVELLTRAIAAGA
jgi:AcrR family transcriptional regulator